MSHGRLGHHGSKHSSNGHGYTQDAYSRAGHHQHAPQEGHGHSFGDGHGQRHGSSAMPWQGLTRWLNPANWFRRHHR